MTQIPAWFQVVIGVCQIVAGLGTLLILHQSNKLNKRSIQLTERLKKADVLMGFDKRWDRMIELREHLQKAERHKIELYYKRYWELQYNQYTFWKNGTVEDGNFYSWMCWRHDDWTMDEKLGGYSYQQSWEDNKQRFEAEGSGFPEFMYVVFHKGAKDAIDRSKQLSKNNKGPLSPHESGPKT